MLSIKEIMERVERIKQQYRSTEGNTPESEEESAPDCPICKDLEWIIDGWKARPCSCLERKKLQRRMKNALIPEEFKDARFDNYKVTNEVQRLMYETTMEYLKAFPEIRNNQVNSLGFIAEVGESFIRSQPPDRRAELLEKYNSYGLGKTHLQMALAKELIKQGYAVLCISDATFMHDLANAKRIDDDGEEFNRLMGAAVNAPVLVWDDIGKSKYSETKEDLYYQIINERWKARRPIIFSSNEDANTLSDRIGPAAFSRLSGMARDYLLIVKGPDYRLYGEQSG